MKPRDVDLLSSYLDGQLSPSDSARLEARLKSEPELVSVMTDLRTARGYLRQLPLRRAPRNFTLTRKMVGQNPPLPRAYPVFRFTTALATLLFFLTYGLNFLAPQFVSQPAYGMGGGGAEVQSYAAEEAPALEAQAPVATEAPAEEPALAVPAPTMAAESAPLEDSTRMVEETPAAKNGEDTGNAAAQDQPQVPPEPQAIPPLIPTLWQYILLGIAFVSTVFMATMRQITIRRWK